MQIWKYSNYLLLDSYGSIVRILSWKKKKSLAYESFFA